MLGGSANLIIDQCVDAGEENWWQDTCYLLTSKEFCGNGGMWVVHKRKETK